MDYEKLKEVIAKQIKENGRREITGPVLQAVLMAMVDSLGEVYPQSYTDEQKAQARANIDALSNHNGEITKEKLSLEVQAILNDVANKQNITDESLDTTSKEVVGAINEIFNGGIKDTSIAGAKLEDAAVTSTKIAARTIIGDNIQNKTIRTEQIADNAITTENIKEYAVTSDKIKDGSITGYKIPNETILERHLGYGSVTKNKIAEGQVSLDKLAFAVQDTLKMVGTNVKEVKSGEDLFSLEDGIYSLNGSTYTNYPIGIPFDASSVCILVVTHSNQRVTLYGVDGSHSSPILPLVAIGDLTNKRWTGGSFYSFFASDYEVGHKLDQKLDNTSTLTDTEVNNIWDNN